MIRSEEIRPIRDQVLLRMHPGDEATGGGIIIPAVVDQDKKEKRAVVIAVGPGEHNKRGIRLEPTVKVGDDVIVQEWGGTDINTVDIDSDGDVHHRMIRERDIQCIIEEDEDDNGNTGQAEKSPSQSG